MQALIPLLIILFSQLMACQRLDNSYELLILTCGELDQKDEQLVWILATLPNELDSSQTQGLALVDTKAQALIKSPKGCFGAPRNADSLLLRHPLAPYAARVEADSWKDTKLLEVRLSTEVAKGFSSESLALGCSKTISNQLSYTFTSTTQKSKIQHFYVENVLLKNPSGPLPGSSLALALSSSNPYLLLLPSELKDGAYSIEIEHQDLFDATLNAFKAKTLSCPLTIDTQYPMVEGFQEKLAVIGKVSEQLLEVKPGQTLSIAAKDANDSSVFICLANVNDTTCDDYSEVNGAFYAPTSGRWRVFYYTRDKAGNISPNKILADFAVINRDLIGNIQSRLNIAELESEKGLSMQANWNLLRAFRDYYRLTLDLEKSILSKALATTFSDVAHENSLQFSVRDHNFKLKKFETLKTERAMISLDTGGTLIARSVDGPKLASFSEVADFSIIDGKDLVILFQSGDLQQGIKGSRVALGAEIGLAQWLVPNPVDLSWAISGSDGLVVIKDIASRQLLWKSPQRQAAEVLSFDPSGGRLALASLDKSFSVFEASTGELLSSTQLNPLCSYRQAILTPRGAFFGSYESRPGQSSQANRCQLQLWSGTADPAPLDLAAITDASSDQFYDPTRYRLDDVVDLSYSPAKNWLAIWRNLPDRSWYIYDLTLNRGRIVYQAAAESVIGSISALHLDAEGRYLSFAIKDVSGREPQHSFEVWNMEGVDLADLSIARPLKAVANLPGAIQQMSYIADRDWIATVDDKRETKAYHLSDSEALSLKTTQKLAPVQAGIQDALALVQGDGIALYDAFANFLKRWPSNGKPIVWTKSLDRSSALAVDSVGGIWEAEKVRDTLVLIGQSSLTGVDSVFLSPLRSTLILSGKDGNGEPRTDLMKMQQGSWKSITTLPIKTSGAVFCPDESRLALGSNRGESLLLDAKASLLLSRKANRSNGFPAKLDQRFSTDCSRWVVQLDSKLEIYDTQSLAQIGASLTIPSNTIGFGFAGNSISDLLLTYPGENNRYALFRMNSRGEQQFLAIFDGLIEDAALQGEALTVYANGLFTVDPARAEAKPEFRKKTGFLSGYFRDSAAILVSTSSASGFGYEFIYRQEDPRLLQRLCLWLEPMLYVDDSEETKERRASCSKL